MLEHAPDRLHSCGACELLDLGQLDVGVSALLEYREDEPALRIGGTWNHEAIMTPDPFVAALAERTLALVSIPSVSHHEEAMYEYVRAHVGLPLIHDDGETLLYAQSTGKPLILLAGHTDTVPPQDNLPGELRDGVVHGLGASDMKGGVAVMMEIGRWAESASLDYDVGLLFFPREEVGPEHNPLPAVFEAAPRIDEAALVICLEPTNNTLQLGCLGNINARVAFEGRAAHSARPWLGENAIAVALEGLRDVLGAEPNDVEVGGLLFREVVSVTQISDGGNASNVIPARIECTLNFRYAPTRTPAEAEARLRELVGRDVVIIQNSPSAHVAVDSPHVERLRACGPFEIGPKQAWTNVADFAGRGLDALNLGPGRTQYAHTADEQVAVEDLVATFEALQRFLSAR